MRYSSLAVAALLSCAQAVTIDVAVGVKADNSPGLAFTPEKVNANTGDVVKFTFKAGTHNVVQSSYDNPCRRLPGTAKSKTFTVAANASSDDFPTYSVKIGDNSAIWIFCGLPEHCQKGMALSINENACGNSTKTLEGYKAAAALVENTCPATTAPTGTPAPTSAPATTAPTGGNTGSPTTAPPGNGSPAPTQGSGDNGSAPGNGGSGSGNNGSGNNGSGSGNGGSGSGSNGSGSGNSGSGSGSSGSGSGSSGSGSGSSGSGSAPPAPGSGSGSGNSTLVIPSGASSLGGSGSLFAMGTALFALVQFGLF